MSTNNDRDPYQDIASHQDVPAVVVCVRCGRPDCPGCEPEEEDTIRSRVLVSVPWENRDMAISQRFWRTVTLTSGSPARFFGGLPKGQLGTALTFAVLVELISVGSWIVVLGLIVYGLFSSLIAILMSNDVTRRAVTHALFVAWLGFSGLLVVARLLYGRLLDRGAVRYRARSRNRQSFRFALYSTGWDLLSSPIGWLVGVMVEGPTGLMRHLKGALNAPSVATIAFLELVYQMKHADAEKVRQRATMAAVSQSVVLIVVVLGVVAAVGLW